MCDGTLVASASGGTVPYTYIWNDPSMQTNAIATGLCAGAYTIVVMDGVGDTSSAVAVVTEPSLVVVTVSVLDASCTNCCDGSATATTTGGFAPYTYSWNDSLMQTTPTATNLCVGVVCVTVYDANGCADTVCITVADSGCAFSVSASSTNITTCGGSDGTATIAPSGGTPPYIYSWSNADTSQTITNLSAGTYTCAVTDANSCTATASVVVTDPGSITLTLTSVDENCFMCCDGSATAVVSGGVSPYTYLWNDSSAAPTAVNLCSGNYCVTVTDNNGCTTNGCITVTDSSGCTLSANISSMTASCGNCDGSATASPSGGTAPYTYLWNDPNNQFNAVATGLCPGTYSVVITDAAGCTSTNTVTIGTGASFTVSIATVDESCLGACDGSATATVSGGTSPYTYNWSDSVSTGATAINLCSNNMMYTLAVLDANSCAGYADSIVISTQSSIAATVTSTNATCGQCDGTASITATSGVSPYTYLWSNGASTQSVSNLCVGSYGVTLTDAVGCAGIYNLVISATASFSVNITTIDDCSNTCSGSATATPSGGTPPYTYLWSDSSMSATATGLCYNMLYTVMVADISGCSVVSTINMVCDSVWPGDANDDNIANNLDILAIGIGSGATGPVRVGANINWVPQSAANWTNSLSNGANYKHVDCNGDGIINDADTTAVITNYGFTHNKTSISPSATAADPELILNILTDTVGLNTMVTVSVELGTPSVPANSVYGLAFTINFNSNLIDGNSLKFDFSGSWLGNMGTDMIGIAYGSPSNGIMDVGMCRTDQNNISGNGQIGLFTFSTIGSMPSGSVSTLGLSLSDVMLISSDETVSAVNLSADSVVVTGIDRNTGFDEFLIGIYPNPFSTTTTVTVDGLDAHSNASLEMYTLLGEHVKSLYGSEGNKFVIDRDQLPCGIYFFNIKVENRLIGTGKLVVN